MKRTTLTPAITTVLTGVVLSAAPLVLTGTAHAAPAAQAGTHTGAHANTSIKATGKGAVKANGKGAGKAAAQATAKAAARVDATINRLDRTLATLSTQAEARLDAETAAQVQSNIAADVQVLAELSVQAETATTLAQVHAVAAQVKDVRVAVYAHAIAALDAAATLGDQITDLQASVGITLNTNALLRLTTAQTTLDAAVDAALSLRADASARDLATVKANLNAATKAFTHVRA